MTTFRWLILGCGVPISVIILVVYCCLVISSRCSRAEEAARSNWKIANGWTFSGGKWRIGKRGDYGDALLKDCDGIEFHLRGKRV